MTLVFKLHLPSRQKLLNLLKLRYRFIDAGWVFYPEKR